MEGTTGQHIEQIGPTLARAREEQGLSIHELQERTKIRGRYLRALEAEAWEALPSAAYAKGFLRTYAGELGLDAEALVDEFRRQVESAIPPADRPYPLGDQVLEHRTRSRDRGEPSKLGPLAIIAVILLVAATGYLFRGLISGDDGEPLGASAPQREAEGREGAAAGGSMTLELEARADVEVCLVAGRSRALIDSQALREGSVEGPFTARRFRLDLLSGGRVRLELDGERQSVSSREPARFLIEGGTVRPAPFAGDGSCP